MDRRSRRAGVHEATGASPRLTGVRIRWSQMLPRRREAEVLLEVTLSHDAAGAMPPAAADDQPGRLHLRRSGAVLMNAAVTMRVHRAAGWWHVLVRDEQRTLVVIAADGEGRVRYARSDLPLEIGLRPGAFDAPEATIHFAESAVAERAERDGDPRMPDIDALPARRAHQARAMIDAADAPRASSIG